MSENASSDSLSGMAVQRLPFRLYVGEVSFAYDQVTINSLFRAHFARFGEVCDLSIHRNKFGCFYAFVQLDSEESIGEILDSSHIFFGTLLSVKRAIACRKDMFTGNNNTISSKIFVRGFPDYLGEEALRKYFSRFASVSKIMLPNKKIIHEDGSREVINRGFAYVVFDKIEDAEWVLSLPHRINGIPLVVEFAQNTKYAK